MPQKLSPSCLGAQGEGSSQEALRDTKQRWLHGGSVSGEAGMHRFICHSKKYLAAPEQMPHTPDPISSSKFPRCLSCQGGHGELEPMSYLIFVGTRQQSGGHSEELRVQSEKVLGPSRSHSVEHASLANPFVTGGH